MKYTKSVSLERDTWEVIEAFQKRTKQKVSRTLEIMINQWLSFTREINKQQKQLETDAEAHTKKLQQATVIKK